MRIIIITICFLAQTFLGYSQGLHSRAENLPCLEKNFPVMVHITVDSSTTLPFLSTTDVEDLLVKTSEFFEPICMSFTACEINVIENYTFHNVVDDRRFREMRVLYGKDHRINIFILGTIPDETCGKSTFYGVSEPGGEYIFLERDACDASLEGQLAHHLGHYFGLSDTYRGDDIEYVTDANCEIKADSICDTPTDPFGIFQQAGVYLDILPLSTTGRKHHVRLSLSLWFHKWAIQENEL